MSTPRGGFTLQDIEGNIYRLWAEKQFTVALLMSTIVAQLLAAQFMLLRIQSATNGTVAPSPLERVDLTCSDGNLQTEDGGAPDLSTAEGKTVVVHLDMGTNACLTELSSVEIGELVVGVSQ